MQNITTQNITSLDVCIEDYTRQVKLAIADGILDVNLVDVNKPAYQITGPRYNLGTHAFFSRGGRSRFQANPGGIVDTVTNWIFVVLCSIIVILSVYISAKRS